MYNNNFFSGSKFSIDHAFQHRKPSMSPRKYEAKRERFHSQSPKVIDVFKFLIQSISRLSIHSKCISLRPGTNHKQSRNMFFPGCQQKNAAEDMW